MVRAHGMDILCLRRRLLNLNFCLQASNPRLESVENINEVCLSEAIESIFPLYTENVIMTWNYINISLSYKYDISYMIDDILKLICTLQKESDGKMIIHWLPDTFRCDWIIEWSNQKIKIYSQWECTIGHLENILNEKNSICLSIRDFVCEWKAVLGVIIRGLSKCGCTESKINDMRKLIEQYENIKEFGLLYRE